VDHRDVHEQRARALDDARPDAVAKQRRRGHLTARERVAGLFDEGTFVEHGLLARPAAIDLDAPADGIVTGAGTIDGRPTAVVSYDYTALGGSQGVVSHAKLDHILELCDKHRWPLVIVAEGAGARPQEMSIGNYGRRVMSFAGVAKLSGRVPLVAIVPGRSFAGHAALAGLCDVIVATRDAAMGIAGPPFVKASTGEDVTADDIGPAALHEEVGAIDVAVDDDDEAIELTRLYLDLVSVPLTEATAPARDPATLRTLVPANSRVAYDMRDVLAGVVDADVTLELRPTFAPNVLTVLARIGGRAVGIVASQPRWLAGALDAPASDKMARFIQLCDSHRLPIVFFADTPGFLVGRDAERSGLVRHSSRPILALAHATVPIMTIVVRKGVGLGYFAMGTRPFDPVVFAAWPTAEFGSMGHQGAATIMQQQQQQSGETATFDDHLAQIRDDHSPLAFAAKFAIDDVIDPADTRQLLAHSLALVPPESIDPARPVRPIDSW
jgi:acetyl-CoA carboxylase carboxyltransferase component